MKNSAGRPKLIAKTYRSGTYVTCGTCGRLLKIEWATRSIVCSCGARIAPVRPGK